MDVKEITLHSIAHAAFSIIMHQRVTILCHLTLARVFSYRTIFSFMKNYEYERLSFTKRRHFHM